MSNETYFRFPLSLLRYGGEPLASIKAALHVGLYNAGMGFWRSKGEASFEAQLAIASAGGDVEVPRKPTIDQKCILVGAQLTGVTLGNVPDVAQSYAAARRFLDAVDSRVFVTMKSHFLWQAIYTARHEAGRDVEPGNLAHPLSWREFRLLCAVLSLPVNNRDFSMAGWEGLRCRSAGFLKAAELDKAAPHCPPLTRSQFRTTMGALEANRFFLRFVHSQSKRGGLSAYSFRHATREELAAAVNGWAEANRFKATLAANREEDLRLNRQAAAK